MQVSPTKEYSDPNGKSYIIGMYNILLVNLPSRLN